MSVRGDVTFEAGGKKFTARFGFLAYEAAEERFDAPFMLALRKVFPDLSPEDALDPAKIAAAGANVRMTDIGTFFEFALLKHHPDLTRRQIGDMIDELGLPRATEIMVQAIQVSIGDQDVGGGDRAAKNPPKRPKGKTG